ncbi:hypothetical protein VPH35_037316 [Triticum aestivum]
MEDAGMEFLLDAVDRFPLREEFADSHGQPDSIPLVLLANIGSGAAVPADSDAGSGCAWGRRRPDSSSTRSAQSTDRVNPQAPEWTKRASRRLRIVGDADVSAWP